MTYLPSEKRYDSMLYRRCGKSGLHLPAISLGFWHNFGEVDAIAVGRAITLRAFDLGITHFDLANNYGPPPGAAEQFLGRILKTDLAGYRDELVISTKAGWRMWPGPYGDWGSLKYLLASLDQSLQRLGLDYVDIFYHHRPDPATPMEESLGALASAVQQGKALYAGISSYTAEQTAKATAILRQLGVPCLIHQQSYNLFNRRLEQGLLEVLAQEEVGCIAYCPLAQGLLTDKYLQGIPAGSRAGKPHGFLKPEHITPEKLACVSELNALAQSRGQTLAQLALVWILRHAGVTSALIGASRVEQVEANVAALLNMRLSDAELGEIEGILQKIV